MVYQWDCERDINRISEKSKLSEARGKTLRKINYNQVRFAIDIVKGLIRRENDPCVRSDLAKAGLTLNNILLK
jgi:hypothetical protein